MTCNVLGFFHPCFRFRDTNLVWLIAYRTPIIEVDRDRLRVHFLRIALTGYVLRVLAVKSFHRDPHRFVNPRIKNGVAFEHLPYNNLSGAANVFNILVVVTLVRNFRYSAYRVIALSRHLLLLFFICALGPTDRPLLHKVLMHGIRSFSARAHGGNHRSGSGDYVSARVNAFYARTPSFLVGDDVHSSVDLEVLCALRDDRVGTGAQCYNGDIHRDFEIRSLDGLRRFPSGLVRLA
jgi:hypothetical protein